MLPLPAKQTKPRPVTVVRPQCAWLCLRSVLPGNYLGRLTNDKPTCGCSERVWPVQARSAFRWVIIQSRRPSSWTMLYEVAADLAAMRRDIGVVETIFW